MKCNYSYDPNPCDEDYTGQPPDDKQSLIVPRRGLEPDTGPDDDPMTVQRRGSPPDADSFMSEEDMDEYPDEYPPVKSRNSRLCPVFVSVVINPSRGSS